MEKKTLNVAIISRMASRTRYSPGKQGWNTFIIDHEGRDYFTHITDWDRMVTVYILMKRFKRRCYNNQFNVAIAMGMSYKLTPARAMAMSRKRLMNMMRIFSLRSRAHYYSRFALAGVDPREYRWPQEMGHYRPYTFDLDEADAGEANFLDGVIKAWFHEHMA